MKDTVHYPWLDETFPIGLWQWHMSKWKKILFCFRILSIVFNSKLPALFLNLLVNF